MACIVTAFVLALCALDHHAFGSAVQYKEHRFKTKVDHFSFHNNKTFEMRYLLGDQHWDRDGGPIFIYTGNEDAIEGFVRSAGLLWEWAPEFSALVIFAEHRFFGSSLPFGDRSFESPNHLGYLTSEQAMADYADLLLHLKYTLPGARKSPVVAFGGSYGAMLAAWMRSKYPHLVDAALASGGPFKMPPGLAPCSTYSEAVTKAYRAESEACVEAIRESWLVMERLASTVSGCELLRKKFNTCQPLHPDNYTIFRDTVRDTYGIVAMANYPDAADLVGSLPANPVKVVCEQFVSAPKTKLGLVDAAAKAMGMFMAGNSTRQCLDVFFYKTGLRTYQFMTCTVLMQPFCGNGVSDMFYPFTWNATAEKERCQREFGIAPDFYGTILMYGGSEFSTATNIIFSNGELDPWSALGILEPPSDDVVVLEIPGAAHHTDLRFASPVDSEAVKEARKVEKNYVRQWIAARDSRPAQKLRVVARRARSELLRERVF